MAKIICGVDVSSEFLDARIGGSDHGIRVERSAEGIGELAVFCRSHAVELVAMEATGGYEKLVFGLLWAESLPCAIVNARSVRHFAEGMDILEKTDSIDAGVIAWYAATKRIAAQPPKSETQERLTALVCRLGQLTQLKTAQTNQRRLVSEPAVIASFEAVLQVVGAQIRSFEQQIASLIGEDPLWRALDAAFREIKGVAARTVARLMADLPEIGTVSNKAIAKLAGLAPIAKDTGKSNGRRHIRGGRAPVRSILFVIAEVVRRHDPETAEFHRRLTSKGKLKMVIRTALARKILVRLNAKARDARRKLQLAA